MKGVLVALLSSALLWGATAHARDDDDDEDDEPVVNVKTGAPAQIGLVQDKLRRDRKNPSALQKLSSDYEDFKTRMEDEHGLTWAFSLSYRQRWIRPDNFSSSSQTLFWPSLNWDIFDSDTYGAGSFQYFYYGERKSSTTAKITRGARTFSAASPDTQDRFSQITYTHTLPSEKLSIAIGQYSFFNFDSSDFMADQQLNFVNNIFSANGSSTYPTTGVGAYVQYNASKTLQLLAGGQRINEADTSKRPALKLASNPTAWLAYGQWKPKFKGLGAAQYSLTLYQAPETLELAQSKGWSINAVQNLNDKWAIFGRLNASSDADGGKKSSHGIGVALNNPLGRNEADQIAVAFGSLEQRLPFLPRDIQHTQKTLEAYWNLSLLDGLLITPDVQYIRHPAFSPLHDSAWIFSLRTTLAF